MKEQSKSVSTPHGVRGANQWPDSVGPVLVFAREASSAGRDDEARRAVEACGTYLRLYHQPGYVTYNPGRLVRTESSCITDETHTVSVEPVPDCAGDPDRVLDCLRLLVEGVALEEESVLDVEVFAEGDIPCIALSFDGPGWFPHAIPVKGFLPLSLEELGARWTLATRGGRIDQAPNGLLLKLSGMRMPPEPVTGLDALLNALDRAARSLESEDTGRLEALNQCLRLVEGEDRPQEPVGLKAVLTEVMEELGPALAERAIVVETMVDPSTPPLLAKRGHLRAFFVTLARYALAILPETGTFTLLIEYDVRTRAASLVAAIDGPNCVSKETFHLAALRRAIVECHGGKFEFAAKHDGITLTAALPDRVGRELDAWVPGFEAFSDRSKQMLRLLKSGGQTPPEDFLLGGMLEAELERWLLPKLAGPAARNMAHEAPEENTGLAGSSTPRLRKALGQIQRGKPRKEIAAPAYAAEILWAFRRDDRHRMAVGAEALDEEMIGQLCLALLRNPPDALVCLRIIARAIAP